MPVISSTTGVRSVDIVDRQITGSDIADGFTINPSTTGTPLTLKAGASSQVEQLRINSSGSALIARIADVGTPTGRAGALILGGSGTGLPASGSAWSIGVDTGAGTPYRDFFITKYNSDESVSDSIYISHNGTSPATIGLGKPAPDTTARVQLQHHASEITNGLLKLIRTASQTGDMIQCTSSATGGYGFRVDDEGQTEITVTNAAAFNVRTGGATSMFNVDTTSAGTILAPVGAVGVGPGASGAPPATFWVKQTSTTNATLTVASASQGSVQLLANGTSAIASLMTTNSSLLRLGTSGTGRVNLTVSGDTIVGRGAETTPAEIATTATAGFLHIPTANGAPTGVPTTVTGAVPIAYDRANNQLYVYNGAWVKTGALT